MPQSLLPVLDYITSPGIIIPTLVTIFIMTTNIIKIVKITTKMHLHTDSKNHIVAVSLQRQHLFRTATPLTPIRRCY